MDVDPKTLLFTQDSVKNTFKFPRENERIDDAVEAILRGDLEASDFPALTVVSYGGRFWSLDNRRLWVFKKARVPSVTVQLISTYSSTRFTELITRNQALVRRILEPGYWPRVRGYCRGSFDPPVQNFYNSLQLREAKLRSMLRSTSRRDYVHDNYNSFNLPGLKNPRLVQPVGGLHGEGFTYYPSSSARVANAASCPAVKVSGRGDNQFTTAKKTSEGGEPEVACGRRDGIEKRRPAPQESCGSRGIRKLLEIVTKYVKNVAHCAVMIVKAAVQKPVLFVFIISFVYYF